MPLPTTASPMRWASTLRIPARAKSERTNGCRGGYSAVGHDQVELHEVERADVAAPVGEVVREQVVRGGVAERRDVRIDEHDDEHPHDERADRDRRASAVTAKRAGRASTGAPGRA